MDLGLIFVTISIAKQDDIEFIVGYENEFCFLLSTDPVKPGNLHQYSDGKGLIHSLRETQCLEEIVNSLIDSGVQVEAWHGEAGPGQVSSIRLTHDWLRTHTLLLTVRNLDRTSWPYRSH
jgi:glutamine synthetase